MLKKYEWIEDKLLYERIFLKVMEWGVISDVERVNTEIVLPIYRHLYNMHQSGRVNVNEVEGKENL